MSRERREQYPRAADYHTVDKGNQNAGEGVCSERVGGEQNSRSHLIEVHHAEHSVIQGQNRCAERDELAKVRKISGCVLPPSDRKFLWIRQDEDGRYRRGEGVRDGEMQGRSRPFSQQESSQCEEYRRGSGAERAQARETPAALSTELQHYGRIPSERTKADACK